MQETSFHPLAEPPPPARIIKGCAGEYKIMRLRECHINGPLIADTPERAEAFWRDHVPASSWFNPEVECFVALFLNTRRMINGWNLVSMGTLDTILVHPREVFRVAIVTAAAAVILCHNHPSGDPSPSEADIKVTRDLIRAGQLLKIEVLDHIILGTATADRIKPYTSLRELGYFCL
jgi:DNA repair protein RadC